MTHYRCIINIGLINHTNTNIEINIRVQRRTKKWGMISLVFSISYQRMFDIVQVGLLVGCVPELPISRSVSSSKTHLWIKKNKEQISNSNKPCLSSFYLQHNTFNLILVTWYLFLDTWYQWFPNTNYLILVTWWEIV